MAAKQAKESIVLQKEMYDFMVRCMTSCGTNKTHAEQLAELLIQADLRGHYSHGLNRLDMYVRTIKAGMTVSNKEPTIVKETAATALVDGNNVLGPVVGKFCIDLAIAKAKKSGIGWVSAKGSNHFGIAGWYVLRAIDQGLLGMAFTNTSPLMVPTRAKKCALGTNPIALGAPAKNGDAFVLDMATTSVAIGKVELKETRGEKMPSTWGVDDTGATTTEPSKVKKGGGLYPLGGPEECGGYKGYGLGMLVEVFCGILSGSCFGPNVKPWKTPTGVVNLGQCFVAIDPNAFSPGFADRMTELMDYLRSMDPAESGKKVLVPGDVERTHIALCKKLGGIPYPESQMAYVKNLAETLKVDPPKVLK